MTETTRPTLRAWVLIALLVLLGACALPNGTAEAASLAAGKAASQAPEKTQDMYRLYNPNSGEHFYTSNTGERDQLARIGWQYEGVAWVAPQSSKTPVYRLYNPYSGDHHYTTSAKERDWLVPIGWRYEGVGWYSDDSRRVAVLRLFNPNAATGSHHYTYSAGERDALVRLGWRSEGTGWYGVAGGRAESLPATEGNLQAIAASAPSSAQVIVSGGKVKGAPLGDVYKYLQKSGWIGLFAMNARTGACITYNADRRAFSASTVKALYIAGLCKYDAPGLSGVRSNMYNAITFSSNEDYDFLVGRYGKVYLRTFLKDCGLSVNLDRYGKCYADVTPRELARAWLGIRSYMLHGNANLGLYKGLFGQGAFYKEGWMYANSSYGTLYHIAGLQGDVVYALMSTRTKPSDDVTGLRDSLVAALS